MATPVENNVPNHFVSVIVPVFNDAERLQLCLEALDNQTYYKELYEVIVVDNGSEAFSTIQAVVSQFSQAYLTQESKPGSYAARNKGISIAEGKIIAFTDSDCIPSSNWVERGVATLVEVPNSGLVAGKVNFFFQKAGKPTAVELYDSLTSLPQDMYLQEEKFAATANLFTWKKVIDHVGNFDSTLKSSGDKEWSNRVFRAGYQQVYGKDVYIAHPARSSYKELFKKIARVTGGKYDIKRQEGYPFTAFIKDLTKDLKPPLLTISRILTGRGIWPWVDAEIETGLQRIELVLVVLFVKYAIAGERTRLYLGGRSRRG